MKIGILGGTFDPVHIGHLVLAESAREQLALDRLVFIPAGQPWRKGRSGVTSGSRRLEMLRLALKDTGFVVSDAEIAREGSSYTVETLEGVRAVEGEAVEMFLVLGHDAFLDLPNWKDSERIKRLARLAVARRPGIGVREERDPPDVIWLSMPLIDISSSEVRQRVVDGRTIRFLVPEAVEAFIREQRLYGEVREDT